MILHKLKTFFALPFFSRRLLVEAWYTQLYTGLVLKIVPFKKIPSLFPNPERETRNAERGTQLEMLRDAIMLTSRYSLWRNKCLVQSLAARKMLKKRGITSQLSLGLRKNSANRLIAHAWLKTGEKEIVSKSGDFLELFVF